MRWLSPLLLLASLLLLGAAPARGADWLSGPELAGAKELLRSSDVPAAKKKIEAVVAADPTNLRARYALVQCHILLGDLDAALAAAEKAVSDHPKSGYSHAALGNACLLLGDFKGADQAYTRAKSVEPTLAVAHHGLAVLLQAQRRLLSARDAFEIAYSLDPTDPQIVLGLYGTVHDPERSLELLLSYRELALALKPAERQYLEAIIALTGALSTNEGDCRLAREATPHQFTLRRLPGGPNQYGLEVSVNGGKRKMALVDTGATGLVIGSDYARTMGVQRLAGMSMRGIGDSGARDGYLGRVARIEYAGLVFEDCLVEVMEKEHLPAVAILGLDMLFRDFEVTLDLSEAMVALQPLPPLPTNAEGLTDPHGYDRSLEKEAQGYARALILNGKLLLPALVNETELSYMLIDTGASETLISQRLARKVTRLLPSKVTVQGLSGQVNRVKEAKDIRLQVGSVRQRHLKMLAIDLDDHAVNVGHGIGGLIGHSLLKHTLLVVDYRNAMVKLEAGTLRKRR